MVKISKILVEIILYCLSGGFIPSEVEPENQHVFRAVDLPPPLLKIILINFLYIIIYYLSQDKIPLGLENCH